MSISSIAAVALSLSSFSFAQCPDWAADFGATTWGQFFLKYVASHPAMTCVIPGTTDVEHMQDNQGAGKGSLPDEATRLRMEQFWDGIA